MNDKDLKKIERLIELMEKSGLTELEIKKPFFRIHLRKKEKVEKHKIERSKDEVETTLKEIKKVEEVKKEPEKKEDKFYYVTAPLVGTFYRAPAPDAEPYVEVGSKIRPGQVLCIIEAMKIMNEIESDVEGVVREILVKNGEPVEYGQKLFKIELV
ncbi:MAG: acetyl-CoA carboxylase biotin carboxyl carrier protein [Candidatus Hydrothermales bacterium]